MAAGHGQRGPLSGHRGPGRFPKPGFLSPIASCAISAAAPGAQANVSQTPTALSALHATQWDRSLPRCCSPLEPRVTNGVSEGPAPLAARGLLPFCAHPHRNISLLTYYWSSALCSLPRGFGTRSWSTGQPSSLPPTPWWASLPSLVWTWQQPPSRSPCWLPCLP